MLKRDIRQNERFYKRWSALREPRYRKCLFSDECKREVINAHSVSKSVLKSMADNGHVKSPEMTFSNDGAGIPKPEILMVAEGINQASTGTFSCHYHDDHFREAIDQTPTKVNDPYVQDLLLYRAVLRELWLLLATNPMSSQMERDAPHITNSIPPWAQHIRRIESLLYLRRCLGESLGFDRSIGTTTPVKHMVRKVRTDYQILACSYAYGGTTVNVEVDLAKSEVTPTGVPTRHGGFEPHICWGFTVIPQTGEHTVLISWLEGSNAEDFFAHFRNLAGKELEAAVSAELLLFCERWFLSPKVWEAYNEEKQRAILTAYGNFPELMSGKFRWSDRGKRPWYEYAGVPNRHQLNLFRYDPSIFKNRP